MKDGSADMVGTRANSAKWNGHRFVRHSHWKWLVVLVLVLGGIIGVALATSNGGGSSSAARGLCGDTLTKMEHNGSMQAMIQKHQSMLEQMRAGISPQMQQRMDADPMWKSMLSGEYTQMIEAQQAQIDRMLGAAPACGAP